MLILFVLLAIVLTVFAVLIILRPLQRGADIRSVIALGLGFPACIILLYLAVSNHNWSNPSTPPTQMNTGAQMPDIEAMLTQLENRLAAQPDDQDGWLMLGRTYAQLGQPDASLRAYRRALALGPANEARLGVAEAEIVLDRNNLSGQAGQLIDAVLAEEPDNPKALFYGGLVSLARQDVDQVRARWQKLLQLSPPDNIREIIEGQLSQLALAPASATSTTSGSAPAVDGIDVRISVAPELATQIKPGAVLYLVAREPGRAGPPVAVIRRDAGQLPVTLTISDADAMLPGASLAKLNKIQLIARIANRGNPVAEPGDYYGEIELDSGQQKPSPLAILIDQVTD